MDISPSFSLVKSLLLFTVIITLGSIKSEHLKSRSGLEMLASQGACFPQTVHIKDEALLSYQSVMPINLPQDCFSMCKEQKFSYSLIRNATECYCSHLAFANLQVLPLVESNYKLSYCGSDSFPCGSADGNYYTVYCSAPDSCLDQCHYMFLGCLHTDRFKSPFIKTYVNGYNPEHKPVQQKCAEVCNKRKTDIMLVDHGGCHCLQTLNITSVGPCDALSQGIAVYCREKGCNGILDPIKNSSVLYNRHLHIRHTRKKLNSTDLSPSEPDSYNIPKNFTRIQSSRHRSKTSNLTFTQPRFFPKCISKDYIQNDAINLMSRENMPEDCVFECKKENRTFAIITEKCLCRDVWDLTTNEAIPVQQEFTQGERTCQVCSNQNNSNWICGTHFHASVYCTGFKSDLCEVQHYEYQQCILKSSIGTSQTQEMHVNSAADCLDSCFNSGFGLAMVGSPGQGHVECLCSNDHDLPIYDNSPGCGFWYPPFPGPCGNSNKEYSVYCLPSFCSDFTKETTTFETTITTTERAETEVATNSVTTAGTPPMMTSVTKTPVKSTMMTTITESITNVVPSCNQCQKLDGRDLVWKACAGQTYIQTCPEGSSGNASWYCDNKTLTFISDQPDRSMCLEDWVEQIIQKINDRKDAYNISKEIINNTNCNDTMITGGGLATLVTALGSLLEVRNTQMQPHDTTVHNFTRNFIQIISNLLKFEIPWLEIPSDKRRLIITRLLEATESSGFLHLSYINVSSPYLVEFQNENVRLSLRLELNITTNSSLMFPEINSGSWISIPAGYHTLLNTDRVKSVGVLYTNHVLSAAIKESTINEGNSQNDTNSLIIGFSINDQNQQIHFPGEGVKITFEHKEKLDGNQMFFSECVFWDPNAHAWNSSGCLVVDSQSNSTHTICQCQHLTNFAVLMDIGGIVDAEDEILSILTLVLSAVSCLALVITLILLYICRTESQSHRLSIQKNRGFCLLVAQLLYLIMVDRRILSTGNTFCQIAAAILHFSWLCAFAWTALEGLQLYHLLVAVFSQETHIWLNYVIGYGIPILIVGATAAVSFGLDDNGYIHGNYCWLRSGDYIWSFTGPVAMVMLMNTIILVMAVYATSVARVQVQKKKKAHIWGSIRSWFIFVSLLGLTWMFGFLYWSESTIIFAYIFTILNSSNGIFIFIVTCCMNKKLKRAVFMSKYRSNDTAVTISKSLTSMRPNAENSITLLKTSGQTI